MAMAELWWLVASLGKGCGGGAAPDFFIFYLFLVMVGSWMWEGEGEKRRSK